MRTRRPATSLLLVAGAVVLLISIVVGQKLGDRVLLQTEKRVPIASGAITPVPDVAASDKGPLRNWKRDQVVSVATDPAFPDPRVTRPPTPSPPPEPVATPRPRPTDTPPPEPVRTRAPYTSPPLPIPLVSHAPAETPKEEPTLSPEGRANVNPGGGTPPP